MTPGFPAAGFPLAEEVPEDPWALLREWLPSNEDPARPVITVATVAPGELADARIQLLSAYDEQGFYIHTDARSRKVEQLAANPSIALVMHFPAELHQLVVQGRAELAEPEELAWAFQHRSPYLQQLAWQNTVEFAGLPLADRIASWRAFAEQHADGFGQPPTWTGYLIRPDRLSFWQGNPETASRRTEYRRTPEGWAVSLLAG